MNRKEKAYIRFALTFAFIAGLILGYVMHRASQNYTTMEKSNVLTIKLLERPI